MLNQKRFDQRATILLRKQTWVRITTRGCKQKKLASSPNSGIINKDRPLVCPELDYPFFVWEAEVAAMKEAEVREAEVREAEAKAEGRDWYLRRPLLPHPPWLGILVDRSQLLIQLNIQNIVLSLDFGINTRVKILIN